MIFMKQFIKIIVAISEVALFLYSESLEQNQVYSFFAL